jgi:hypothetical protein
MPATTTAQLSGNSIVLLGVFDPSLVQPRLLFEEQILRETDLAELTMDIVLPDTISFHLPWMTVSVETIRFAATTTLTSPAGEPVRDFVADVIDTMKTARVRALGINTDMHFGTSGADAWHRIGHTLAPKEGIWKPVLKEPGLQTMSIKAQRDDEYGGYLLVKVEPSTRIQHGIYVSVNDHFEISEEELEKRPRALSARLSDQWTSCTQRADRIISQIRSFEGVAAC